MLKKVLWLLVDYLPFLLPGVASFIFINRGDGNTAMGMQGGVVLVCIAVMIQELLRPDHADNLFHPL